MKVFVLISIFCVIFSAFIYAQDTMLPDEDSGGKTNTEKQTTVKKSVKSVIRCWTLDKQNSTLIPENIDTATIDFHNYTPIFQKSISNIHLGYLGAPYISNQFFDRLNYSDYYFLSSFEAYRRTQRDVTYFNTTTPFSLLKYEQGGDEEQIFTAFFTQNIDSATNVGFRYSVLKNSGQYKIQEANHKNLNFFISRNSKRYNGYASVISASDKIVENGGVANPVIDLSRNPYELVVNLSRGIGPTIKTFSFFTSHEYLLGKMPFFKKDSLTDSIFSPRYGIQYSFEMNNYNRDFSELSVSNDFFDSTYFSSVDNRIDSSNLLRITQIIQIKAFENKNRKFTFGKRVFLENETVRATHPINYGVRRYNYSNLFLGGEISNKGNSFIKWSALARFAFLGRNFGDAQVKGTIDKPLKLFRDTLLFSFEGWYRDISPDVFQEHWNDNHFKWENKFNKQHEIVFNATLHWDQINLHTGANYAMLSNFLYNGRVALPSQYSGEFSVFSFWLNKEFTLGPFGWNNKLMLQNVTNDTVLHIPSLNCYTSVYFKGVLFKVMKYQLGAEMYYNSQFFADNYEPSTSRFYLQDNVKTGGYPQLNAFINAKLKRTSAFVQIMHFNSSFSNGEFFSSPTYPINQFAFRFGFLWSFYD